MAPKRLIHSTLAQKRALSIATLRLRVLRQCGTLRQDGTLHTYQLAQCLPDAPCTTYPRTTW